MLPPIVGMKTTCMTAKIERRHPGVQRPSSYGREEQRDQRARTPSRSRARRCAGRPRRRIRGRIGQARVAPPATGSARGRRTVWGVGSGIRRVYRARLARNMPETIASRPGNRAPLASLVAVHVRPVHPPPLGDSVTCSAIRPRCSSSSRTRMSSSSTSASPTCPGVQQHFNIPASTVDEEFFTVGQLFDGSSIRGFQSIHESDMQLIPDVSTAYVDPFRAERTLVMIFDIYNPRNGEIYAPRPAPGRQEGREVPRLDRHRRHRVLRPRGRVLHLRRRALRGEAELELLLGRLRARARGTRAATKRAATSPTRPRTRAATSPSRPVDKQADLRDDIVLKLIDAGLMVERCAPRGRHRRPGRDQLPVRHDGARGRRHPEVQVHRQEHRRPSGARPRRSCRSRSSATTARACTPTSRCGTTASRCSTTRRATAASPTSPAGTSAAC